MAQYTLELDAFIPWKKLAGSFQGDKRGFFAQGGTSRLHLVGTFDTQTKTFAIDAKKSGCDPTLGRLLFVGPHGEKTADLHAVVPHLTHQGDSSKIDLHMQAANPLVPGAPPIDFSGAFTFTEYPATGQVEILSTLSGSNFPAIEAKVSDQAGVTVFLGGYAPESKEEISRLIDGATQHWLTGVSGLGVVNTGQITLNTDGHGAILSVDQGTNLGVDKTAPLDAGKDPVHLLSVHHEVSVAEWNHALVDATPLVTDATDNLLDVAGHHGVDSALSGAAPPHTATEGVASPTPHASAPLHFSVDSAQVLSGHDGSLSSSSPPHHGADSAQPAPGTHHAVDSSMPLHGTDSTQAVPAQQGPGHPDFTHSTPSHEAQVPHALVTHDEGNQVDHA